MLGTQDSWNEISVLSYKETIPFILTRASLKSGFFFPSGINTAPFPHSQIAMQTLFQFEQ